MYSSRFVTYKIKYEKQNYKNAIEGPRLQFYWFDLPGSLRTEVWKKQSTVSWFCLQYYENMLGLCWAKITSRTLNGFGNQWNSPRLRSLKSRQNFVHILRCCSLAVQARLSHWTFISLTFYLLVYVLLEKFQLSISCKSEFCLMRLEIV